MTQKCYLLSKSLLTKIALVAALMSWGGIAAEADELTVFPDASATTNNFPISGGYINTVGVRSEFIIPQSELSSIAAKRITKLTFFHKDAQNWGTVQFKVYMKVVNQTTFSSKEFLGSYDSPVYTGSINLSADVKNGDNQYETDITLDTPFDYSGDGDLLIGFYCSSAGTTKYPYFYGDYKSSTNYGLYTTYYNGSFSYSYGYYRLKTKFTYENLITPLMYVTHPDGGDAFGYVTTNISKTYTVKNIGIGSMAVNITSNNSAFTLSTSSLSEITNDGVGKSFDVTFNYDAVHPEPHNAVITITPTFEGAVAQNINVSAGPEVEFNEDKITTWTSGSGKNIYVKYTAKNGWNTICIPINPNTYKTSLYGSGATVKHYALNNYDSTNGTLTFEYAPYPGSGIPYLVYVENAESNAFILTGVLVGGTGAGTVTKGSATFKGTYAPIAASSMPDGSYGITNAGKIVNAGLNSSIKGYRAYFSSIPSGAGARILVLDDDDETTDLGFVKMVDPDAKDVYNMNGQRVQKGRKGLYVVNGKKVVLK